MRSAISGYLCLLLAVCTLCSGIHIDLDHWIQYDANSCDTFSEAYITTPDEYPEVEIAIRQSEQTGSADVRILPGKIFRKVIWTDLHALLPQKAFYLQQCFGTNSDYIRVETEIESSVSVVLEYLHQQDGRKRS